MRRRFRHQHGNVAADGGKHGQRFERFGRNAAGQHLLKIQFRQKNGVAQIVAFLQDGRKLAHFAQGQFAELNGGGLKEKGLAVLAARPCHPAQAELFEKFLQRAFQIVDIELGVAFRAGPKGGGSAAGQGEGEAAFLLEFAARPKERRGRFQRAPRPGFGGRCCGAGHPKARATNWGAARSCRCSTGNVGRRSGRG